MLTDEKENVKASINVNGRSSRLQHYIIISRHQRCDVHCTYN